MRHPKPGKVITSQRVSRLLRKTYVAGAVGLLSLLANALGHAASVSVIDFDQLASSPPRAGEVLGDVDDPYYEDGFLLTTPQSALRSVFPESGTLYAGSIAVFNEYLNGLTILRATDNQPFKMVSAKLSKLLGNDDVTITFTGLTPLGDIVTASFARMRLSPKILTTEFFPTSFSNVIQVSWIETGTNDAMQIDDLTMSLVPEPATGTLGIAFSLALLLRRGRRESHLHLVRRAIDEC